MFRYDGSRRELDRGDGDLRGQAGTLTEPDPDLDAEPHADAFGRRWWWRHRTWRCRHRRQWSRRRWRRRGARTFPPRRHEALDASPRPEPPPPPGLASGAEA